MQRMLMLIRRAEPCFIGCALPSKDCAENVGRIPWPMIVDGRGQKRQEFRRTRVLVRRAGESEPQSSGQEKGATRELDSAFVGWGRLEGEASAELADARPR